MTAQPSNDLDTPVWGARAIGAVLNRSPDQTFRLLERKKIDAEKIGGMWVSTRRRLLSRFLRGEPL